MRYRVIVPVFAAAFVLQPFLNSLLPWNSAPELIVSAGLMLCFFYSPEDALPAVVTASALELLHDLAIDQYAGASVVAFVAAAAFVLLVKQFINIENALMTAGVYLGAIIIEYVAIWILYRLAGSPYGFIYAMSKIPASVIGDFLFGMILYFIFVRRLIKHRRDRYFR